jgi:methylation protein EvaC
MYHCQICTHEIEPFISFGRMPIANGFLMPDQFSQEYFYNLIVGFCPECKMVQLLEFVDREKMFHEQYAFFSSTSSFMARHFGMFAEKVIQGFLAKVRDPFVVEIGSNDGILLENFSKRNIRHLGIEPSANVAEAAIRKGVKSICAFFDENIARQIVSESGHADAIIAANVMCHIPYLHSVAKGIKLLLKSGGIFIFEDPYLGDIVEKVAYDQIYDEHAFYFSLQSIHYLFSQYDLEVIHTELYNVHGGSMRYYISHKGSHAPSSSVMTQIDKENMLGLHQRKTYELFRKSVEKSKDQLKQLLLNLKNEKRRVVGYAATSKSTTVTNYCGITPDLLEYMSDTTPIKQGKYSPGAHIPVRPYEEFKANYPDYALLFGWNHAEEIMAKENEFCDNSGKWIVYVPKVKIIG